VSEDEQKIEFKKGNGSIVFQGDGVAKMNIGAMSDTQTQSLEAEASRGHDQQRRGTES
jgi:hypothetical protein